MKDAGVGQAGDEFECGGGAATLKFIPKATNPRMRKWDAVVLTVTN
jgi:hypothetical protein